jgi:hypothetical protein
VRKRAAPVTETLTELEIQIQKDEEIAQQLQREEEE